MNIQVTDYMYLLKTYHLAHIKNKILINTFSEVRRYFNVIKSNKSMIENSKLVYIENYNS